MPKLIRNLNDEESRLFWEGLESAVNATTRRWPKWYYEAFGIQEAQMTKTQTATLTDIARDEGRRAAAQGDVNCVDNPFLEVSRAWEIANRLAVANLHSGRDSDGHPASPPHLCSNDSTKVCVCCRSCTTNCVPAMRLLSRVVQYVRGKLLP